MLPWFPIFIVCLVNYCKLMSLFINDFTSCEIQCNFMTSYCKQYRCTIHLTILCWCVLQVVYNNWSVIYSWITKMSWLGVCNDVHFQGCFINHIVISTVWNAFVEEVLVCEQESQVKAVAFITTTVSCNVMTNQWQALLMCLF